MWGDVGRCGEMWGDEGRCGETRGDMGRCGSCAVMAGTSNEWSSGQTNGRDISTWGNMGRYGEIWADKRARHLHLGRHGEIRGDMFMVMNGPP